MDPSQVTETTEDREHAWYIFTENRDAVIAALERGECDGILPAARGFLDGFAEFCLEAGIVEAWEAFPDRRVRRTIPMYFTTVRGDNVWVVEVTEAKEQVTFFDMAEFFRKFAAEVDTSDIALLEISVIKSETYIPYMQCVRSEPARAAANGTLADQDLIMKFVSCPQ